MLTEKAEKHLEKSKQKLAALEAKMERRKEEQRLYDEMIITIAAKVFVFFFVFLVISRHTHFIIFILSNVIPFLFF